MNYFYDTATEMEMIRASKKWVDVLEDEDRKISSQDRKERRHTVHYDVSFEAGSWLASDKDNPFYNLCRETPEEMKRRLRRAIRQLTEDQQRLIDYIYYRGYSMKAFAEMEGVHPSTVTRHHQEIIKKLKEIV